MFLKSLQRFFLSFLTGIHRHEHTRGQARRAGDRTGAPPHTVARLVLYPSRPRTSAASWGQDRRTTTPVAILVLYPLPPSQRAPAGPGEGAAAGHSLCGSFLSLKTHFQVSPSQLARSRRPAQRFVRPNPPPCRRPAARRAHSWRPRRRGDGECDGRRRARPRALHVLHGMQRHSVLFARTLCRSTLCHGMQRHAVLLCLFHTPLPSSRQNARHSRAAAAALRSTARLASAAELLARGVAFPEVFPPLSSPAPWGPTQAWRHHRPLARRRGRAASRWGRNFSIDDSGKSNLGSKHCPSPQITL